MLKRTPLKMLLGSILIGASAAVSAPVMAVNEAMLDLLEILRDKGSITAEEYDLLRNAARADGEKVEGSLNEMQANVDKKTKDMPKINTSGKLEISHGDNKLRVGGRLQADTTFGAGSVDFESEGGEPITEFRRARMYLSGVFQKYWKYKFQYDFAGQSAVAGTYGIRDAYLAYTGFKPVTVTLGNHKMPLSLEELTSSKYITFIERSQLVNGIVTDTSGGRKYGLSAHAHFNDMFTLAGASYIGTANEDHAEEDGFGFAGRVTFSPIHEKTRMAHLGLGLAADYRSDGGYNIDGEPEIHPGRDILETENGDWETATTWVAEAAAIHGPWALQAEYASSRLSKGNTTADADATAWYVYGSYYLTGESRNYKWKNGSYSQTRVNNPLHKGGAGAFEVALRYTSGDFENAGKPLPGASRADILTAGLNWYPSNNIRFSANYVNVLKSNRLANDELRPDLKPGASAEDAEYFIVRGQWYF